MILVVLLWCSPLLTAIRAESKAYIQDSSAEAPDFHHTIGTQNAAIKISSDQLNGKMVDPTKPPEGNNVSTFNGNGKAATIDHHNNDFTPIPDEKINTDVWLTAVYF